MKDRLLLIGAGGHCRVILDHLLQAKTYTIAGIIDVKERVGENVLGIPIIGTDDDCSQFYKNGVRHCFISAGSIGDPILRVKLYEHSAKLEFIFPNIIHPSALISSRASLGAGNYIAPGAIINVNAQIGDQCIINSGAIIEHDSKLGNFVHIASGAVLSGGVKVGDHTHVGTGASVIQCLEIGARVVIGAGSVVTKNIPSGVIAYGNPSKEKRNA